MKIVRLLAAVLFAALMSAGQAGEPILNRENIVIPEVGAKKLTADDVKRAIMAGGARRGWMVTKDEPGKLELTINVRAKHTAIVAVTYDSTRYSVTFVSALNLDHDPAAGTIHRNYNRWTNNLVADINAELLRI